MAKGHVEPFHADTELDKKTTVIDFVEKIETVMGDCLLPQRCRLAMVRWFLRDGALVWLNLRLSELAAKATKEGRDLSRQPIDWDADMRRPFIQAHMGTDTVELWLAKLSALRVGKGKSCKDPIELDSKFDAIARPIYPRHTVSDDRTDYLLVTKYKEILIHSQPDMYKQIAFTRRRDELMSLRDWKEAFAHVWTTQQEISAAMPSGGDYRRSGWNSQRGRGGGRAGQPTTDGHGVPAKSQSVNGVGTDESERAEGQPEQNDGDSSSQQLSAAAGSGQRGGKGTRGGGGRGGGAGQRRASKPPMTAEQRQRFIDGLCIQCGESGHIARDCPKAQAGSE